MSSDKLTPKQQRFVDAYLISLNATQAAITAGYSKRSAANIGSRLLEKSTIKSIIDENKTKITQKAAVTAEMVVDRLVKIGFADISYENIRPTDQLAAIVKLVEYLELFKQPPNKLEVTGQGGGPINFAELPLFDKGILKELSTDELSVAEKLIPMFLERISKGNSKGKGESQP